MAEQLFKIPFHYYAQQALGKVRDRAQRLSLADLANEEEAATTLASEYRLQELDVDLDELVALPGHREEESFHADVFGDRQRVVTPIYTFELPYQGSSDLWWISPSSSRLIHLEGNVNPARLRFEIRGADKARLEQIKGGIRVNVDNQKQEVASYNSQLNEVAAQAVARRKQELQQHDDGLSTFGVPVKGRDN